MRSERLNGRRLLPAMMQAVMSMFRDINLRFQQVRNVVRLRPFEVVTVEGRSSERHRRAMLTTLAAVLARSVSIATALITVPLTLEYLGTERYGMWMTMSSVVAMIAFTDLGIGNGLLNAISSAYGKDDFSEIKEYVSSGMFALGGIALAILAIFGALYYVVPWYEVFNVKTLQAKQEAGPALAVFVACFAIAIPFNVVQRVQMGLQKGFLANLWLGFSSIFALGCVVLAVWMRAGLPWLVLAYAGSPLVASLLNGIVYFGWQERQSAPAFSSITLRAMKRIANIGISFFVIQIAGVIVFASDNIVIAQVLGAHFVAGYAVPQRLFSIVPGLLSMALVPLWPAYSEAISRGDHGWAWRTLKRTLILAMGSAALASIVLVFGGKWLIALWVGPAIATSMWLLLGLGIWQVVQAGGIAVNMYLNAANVMRFLTISCVSLAVVAVVLKICLVTAIGVAGVIWATIISYVLCVGIPTYLFLRKKSPAAHTEKT